jgi:hypothetical protein
LPFDLKSDFIRRRYDGKTCVTQVRVGIVLRDGEAFGQFAVGSLHSTTATACQMWIIVGSGQACLPQRRSFCDLRTL